MTPRPSWDAGLLVLGAFLFGSGIVVGQLSHDIWNDIWLSRIDESTRFELMEMTRSTQTALNQVEQALKNIPTCAPPSRRRLSCWWKRPLGRMRRE